MVGHSDIDPAAIGDRGGIGAYDEAVPAAPGEKACDRAVLPHDFRASMDPTAIVAKLQ